MRLCQLVFGQVFSKIFSFLKLLSYFPTVCAYLSYGSLGSVLGSQHQVLSMR